METNEQPLRRNPWNPSKDFLSLKNKILFLGVNLLSREGNSPWWGPSCSLLDSRSLPDLEKIEVNKIMNPAFSFKICLFIISDINSRSYEENALMGAVKPILKIS